MPFLALFVGPAKVMQYAKSIFKPNSLFRGVTFGTNPNLMLAITDTGYMMIIRTLDGQVLSSRYIPGSMEYD